MVRNVIYRTELIPKNSAILIVIGSVFLTIALFGSIVAMFVSLWLAIPTAIAMIVGIYLLLWATCGKDFWRPTRNKAPGL